MGDMGKTARLWWLPGTVVGLVGVFAIVAGIATGGADAVGGVIFGGVALIAAGVILRRRVPNESLSKSPDSKNESPPQA
jgi:hypothetical protein